MQPVRRNMPLRASLVSTILPLINRCALGRFCKNVLLLKTNFIVNGFDLNYFLLFNIVVKFKFEKLLKILNRCHFEVGSKLCPGSLFVLIHVDGIFCVSSLNIP